MNTAIQNTVSQYLASFIGNVSETFSIPLEKLNEMWKETQKEKFKPRRLKQQGTKKTPSAYINFCKHRRPTLNEASPALTFGEKAKELGRLWKELDVEEKKRYADPEYVGTSKPTKVDEETKTVKKPRKKKE